MTMIEHSARTPPRSRRKRSIWKHLGFALFALFVVTAICDGQAGGRLFRLLDEAPLAVLWRMLVNLLPGLMLALLLLAVSRRVWFSFAVAAAITALVYGVNAIKVANLATPLMPADFLMLGQLGSGGLELLGKYLPSSVSSWLLLLGIVAVVVLAWRFEPKKIGLGRAPRWCAAVLLAAASVSLVLAAPFWNHVYNAEVLRMQPWSARNTVRKAGLISTVILFHLRYAPDPAQANVGEARALTAKHEQALANQLARPTTPPFPDIVVVQSESFFDPAILKGISDHRLTPALQRLRKRGLHGNLRVPTFGGATIRTEFEVLTGLSLRYFPEVRFPYLELHPQKIPSILGALEDHGYITLAIHPNRAEFWNRSAAFHQLGFDQFIALDDFPPDTLDGHRYAPDSALTEMILAELKDGGPPQFLFAISMEVHGPYRSDPDIDDAQRATITLPTGVTGEPAVALGNYFYHLRHADAELGRLAEALAKRNRPTLLLFYGDHLPALVPAFKAAGFDNGQSFFRQTVPWLLIRPGHPAVPRELDLAADMLPGVLLEAVGIHDQPYFALTLLVGKELAFLSQAPDAPPIQPTSQQARIDDHMADVARLRYQGKLAPIFAEILKTP